MGIGHLGIAFAAKRVAPQVSLGLLLGAALFVDGIWAIGVAAGIEHVRIVPGITAANPFDLYDFPWSHSLLAVVGWSVAVGGFAWALGRGSRAALVLAALVFSHWPLDAIAHRPDLPVLPAGPYVGLGLWNSVAGTLVVETLLLLAGVFIYWRYTQARGRLGEAGLMALVVFFLGMNFAAYLGPPPPSIAMVTMGTASLILPLVLAHLLDRRRTRRV